MAGLCGVAIWLEAFSAAAGPATDVVRDTVDQVLKIANDKALSEPQRRARIKQVILRRFGFEEMARQSMGRHWNDLSPGQRNEFITLFTDLLERTYINDIEAYKEGQEIQYGAERVEGDQIEVPSTVLTEARDRIPVNYRLLKTASGWQVYDLVVDGVSLVQNYRSQFGRIIEQQGYATLLKRIRAKVKSEQAVEHMKGHSTETIH